MSLLIMGTASFAQNKEATKPAKKASTTAKEKQNAQTAQPAQGKTLVGEQKSAKMKKDGTPDMRYKENKAAKPAGPLKKDGTPDMRYKANKTGTPTKK